MAQLIDDLRRAEPARQVVVEIADDLQAEGDPTLPSPLRRTDPLLLARKVPAPGSGWPPWAA